MIHASHGCVTLVVLGDKKTSSIFESSNVGCAAQLSTIRTIFRPANFILMFNLFTHSANSIPVIHGFLFPWYSTGRYVNPLNACGFANYPISYIGSLSAPIFWLFCGMGFGQ